MQLIKLTTLVTCAVALSEATLADNNTNASIVYDVSKNVTMTNMSVSAMPANSSTVNTSSVPTFQLADDSREK